MTQPRRLFAATLLALPMLGALPSCHLIDQRSFDKNAGVKPVPPPGPVVKSTAVAPLVTIAYTTPDPDYASELTVAVKRALALKPNVLFSVQSFVPLAATPAAQATALQAAAAAGREIAEAIIADGADQGQIEHTVRADPSLHVQEVRVFVH
jgi:hypothetical protein